MVEVGVPGGVLSHVGEWLGRLVCAGVPSEWELGGAVTVRVR